jgi:hypothetical protein
MKTFTIENETTNITLHASLEAAQAVPDSEQFATAEEFASLTGGWHTSRLVEIWNGIPGVTPVKKFKDRATGATRIWAAIQSLGGDLAGPEANVSAQVPDVAPAEEPATMQATSKEEAPTGERPPSQRASAARPNKPSL